MTDQLPLIDRVLIEIAKNPLRSAAQIGSVLEKTAPIVHTAMWTLRTKKLLDSDNRLTTDRKARVDQLTAEHEEVAETLVDAFAPPPPPVPANDAPPEKKKRGPKPGSKRAKNAEPAKKAPKPKRTAVVPAIAAPAPTNRIEAAHRVADSVIGNARNAQRVLREYLDESVEVGPLLESLLDQMAGAITLIEQTYHAAR